MKKTSKKMAVLLALQKLSSPVSMPELLQTLGEQYAERSVRRWLNELYFEKQIEKTGNRKATKYEIKKTSTVLPEIFSKKSYQALHYLKEPLFLRTSKTYEPKWLKKYIPNKTFYLSAQQRKLLEEKSYHSQKQEVAGTYARKIYNRLLIDLTYNSSRLEGNTYSLIDTERLILKGEKNPNKLNEEAVMILNHKEAIRYLIENASKIKIHPNEICTVHYLLSDGLVLPEQAGKIRNHPVRITSTTYHPMDNPKQLSQILSLICDKAEKIRNPFEQSLFLLAQLAYLQPFADVNKRTSRLSANIPLIKNNLTPLSFQYIDKDDYISCMLAIYELNDIKPLSELYVYSYINTASEYSKVVDQILIDEVRIEFRQQRRIIVRDIILQRLYEKKCEDFIKEQSKSWIPKKYISQFIKNVHEDLDNLSPQTIAALGITALELKCFLNNNKTRS